jgi:hypothetical protein
MSERQVPETVARVHVCDSCRSVWVQPPDGSHKEGCVILRGPNTTHEDELISRAATVAWLRAEAAKMPNECCATAQDRLVLEAAANELERG